MAHSHAGVDATTAASGAEHQKRLMMSLGLTSTVFIAEVVSAIVTGSLALLVDAGHMLTDMSVLIASTVTAVLMQRKPSNKRTWGWARLEVLTAAVGALVLLIVGIYALVRSRHEAVRRSRRRSTRRAVAAVHGHTRPCRQRRFDLHPRGAKRGQHEYESRVPRSHERRIGVRGRDRFSHRADLNGLGRLRCRRGRHHRIDDDPRAFVLLRNAVRVLLEKPHRNSIWTRCANILSRCRTWWPCTTCTPAPSLPACPSSWPMVVERGLTMDDAADILSQLQNCLREHFPVSVPHTTFQLEPEGYDSDSRKELHS